MQLEEKEREEKIHPDYEVNFLGISPVADALMELRRHERRRGGNPLCRATVRLSVAVRLYMAAYRAVTQGDMRRHLRDAIQYRELVAQQRRLFDQARGAALRARFVLPQELGHIPGLRGMVLDFLPG